MILKCRISKNPDQFLYLYRQHLLFTSEDDLISYMQIYGFSENVIQKLITNMVTVTRREIHKTFTDYDIPVTYARTITTNPTVLNTIGMVYPLDLKNDKDMLLSRITEVLDPQSPSKPATSTTKTKSSKRRKSAKRSSTKQ